MAGAMNQLAGMETRDAAVSGVAGDPVDHAEAAADERASILVVDDLPEKLLVFGTILEELGEELVFVRSGAEALREVLHREFAVILLDVNMPDIDGFETASLIRKYKKSAHTPIIFVTSYADEMQTGRGYSLGAVDFILSPVAPEVLRTKVRVFVELHAMRQRVKRQGDERAARMAAEAARYVAEQNDRRSNFLAEASRALSETLDIAVGERRLLEALLPSTATLALLMRPNVDAGLERGLLGCVDQRGHTRLCALRHDELGAHLQAALERAFAGDVRVGLDAVALADLNHAARSLPGASALHAAVVVPMGSKRRRMGVLLVGSEHPPEDRAAYDWSILEELAARAANAFENAELLRSLQMENAERVAAEAKLQEASRRKDEFLAMLSHELRNPLAPLRNALELVRRVAPQEARLNWAGEVMDRQLRHLTRLVEELLDVARITEGKIVLSREPVDLRAVIEASIETAQPFIEQHRQKLQVRLPETPAWMQGDFARLAQVVGNLLHNAAKYSPEASTIGLELAARSGEATIRVRDNGVGIEASLLPSIFELFTQGQNSLDRTQGGLGVGLTLVRRLVELHGGSVEARSDGANQGAEFIVRLPAVSVVSNEEGTVTMQALPANSHGRRVLIVDDNRDAAETIAQFLQLEGHEAKFVGDGPQALASVPVLAPQVVVLDIGLPGMSGYETAKRMREMPSMRDALLIALTGYGQVEDRRKAEEAGFDHHFVKPADPQALAELIAGWAERSGRSQRDPAMAARE
jgi:signal transduction histidine kinase/DNA-binding response OmpR family regulator